MDTPTPPKQTSFSHQAAKLSWVCPVIIFLLLMFSRQIGARMIIELVALLLIVAGLIFGIVALFGISKHGTKGILAPAIVGIIINGLLLFIFITNFLAARAGAMQQHSSIEASPVVAISNTALEPRTPSGSRRASGCGCLFVGHLVASTCPAIALATAEVSSEDGWLPSSFLQSFAAAGSLWSLGGFAPCLYE